jgi:hypothetical protein
MRTFVLTLVWCLPGCLGEFVFEVSLSPIEPDVTVIVDDEPVPASDYMGSRRVFFERTFSEYSQGVATGSVDITVMLQNEVSLSATVQPGICKSEGADWEREHKMFLIDYMNKTITLARYECENGSTRVGGVVY